MFNLNHIWFSIRNKTRKIHGLVSLLVLCRCVHVMLRWKHIQVIQDLGKLFGIFSCMLSSELICLLYFVQWSYSDSDLAISFKERHAAHIAWAWYDKVSISRIDFKSIEKLFNVIHMIQSNWSNTEHVNNIIINSHLLVLPCLPMSMVACTKSRIVTY
jgi:hypothetical protein